MPSVYDVKPRFQAMLRPATRRLAGAGVTANQVTVLAAVLSVAAGGALCIGRWHPWVYLLLPATLLLRMALNAIDGMLAREFNQKSLLGAILNELGDVFSDSVLYLPLIYIASARAELVVLLVLLAVISEMTGVLGLQIGASRRYDGPMGKSDRALVLGIVGLLIGCGLEAGEWLNYVLVICLLGLVVTIVNRARGALAEVHHAA